MKYFITGATGFVGGRITAMLREKGHIINALVRNPDKATALDAMGVNIFKGDITDKQSMRDAINGCDGVFHVAAWYKVGARDKSVAQPINVDGTRNVLELMQEYHIRKGVYTSTLAVNSNTNGRVYDESYRFTGQHLSEYDRTKAEAHRIAEKFIAGGLPLVIVMPGMIYGPDGTNLTDEAWRLYLRKKLPLIPQKSAFSWAHVDDVAEAHLLAMEKASPGSKYIVAGPSHTLTGAFEIAEKITGIRKPRTVPPWLLKGSAVFAAVVEKFFPLPEMYTFEALRVQAGVTYLGDNSKAKKELGYDPRPLEEGLRETLVYEMEQMEM